MSETRDSSSGRIERATSSKWTDIRVLEATSQHFTITDYEGFYLVDTQESPAYIVVRGDYDPSSTLHIEGEPSRSIIGFDDDEWETTRHIPEWLREEIVSDE